MDTLPSFAQEIEAHSERTTEILSDIIARLFRQVRTIGIDQANDDISIRFSPDHGPVRKINKRSNYRVTGFMPSRKNNNVQQYESDVELSGLMYLEACPLVKSYQVQPAVIEYSMGGKAYKHTPDVMLELISGHMGIAEFKDPKRKEDEFLLARTEYLTSRMPALGYSYWLIFPDQMPLTIHNNSDKLNRHAMPIKSDAQEIVRQILTPSRMMTIEAILETLKPKQVERGHIYELIRLGFINFDWHLPLNKESLIVWRTLA